MATAGDFRVVGEGDSAKKFFVVADSNITVEESSVSSDWTTESEPENAKPASNFDSTTCQQDATAAKGKKRRIRNWRVRHNLAKHRHLRNHSDSNSDSDTSSASSSSTSSGSKSNSEDDRAEKNGKRRDRNDRRMASSVHMVNVEQDLVKIDPNSPLLWTQGGKTHRRLAFAFGFLNSDEIAALTRAANDRTVKEIFDRKQYLAFKHRVVRFEMQLRALEPALYAKLMALMRAADAEGWKRLRKKKSQVYPEVEFIEYDVEREQGECYIEPHVDNKSGVTLVAMLSPSTDYVGGSSCFRRASGIEGHRQARLEMGDVVMFRGEKLLHWITNVTSGRRVILQIELSRV
eukprot:TRINITY_DN21678_c0_g5_i1.p1 TRINITY_DN21678_c0_g5~~TRINITY_DN21678_c0_g5_i1.p1  ORF type:complete len:347 (+),score=64.98 TRINITY_DN21678_c0_g5_i1:72-1112(+)